MITFSRLGTYGHLGNQMFQYAALKGIAAHRNYEWAVPSKAVFNASRSSIYECFALSSISENNLITNQSYSEVQETSYNFDKNFYDNCVDNIDLTGYFQSARYFENISDEIKKDFEFLHPLEISVPDDFASLHVRRTDYLNMQGYLPIVGEDYYSIAINAVPNNMPIIIFSDDIEWCQQQKIFQDDRFIFSNQDAYSDMQLMSMARINITANSTFSWWAAWLNKNTDVIIITPRTWFGPLLSHQSIKDLIPKEWIII
jgi:hypothetical protein